jgi:hypothetical protein
MIGIQVAPEKMHIAGEFFELFKTAWEPAEPERCYSLLLLTDWIKGDTPWNHANTIIIFSSSHLSIDLELGLIPVRTKFIKSRNVKLSFSQIYPVSSITYFFKKLKKDKTYSPMRVLSVNSAATLIFI